MNRAYALVGVVAATTGLLVLLVPSLGGGPGAFTVLVPVAGVVAVAQGLLVVADRYRADRHRADVPSVESAVDFPAPGTDMDDRLGRLHPASRTSNEAVVRERLEAAALRVLAREGHSHEAARALLDGGEWTDDPAAAAFFAADEEGSTRTWLETAVSDEPVTRRRARRAAIAIADRAEGRRG